MKKTLLARILSSFLIVFFIIVNGGIEPKVAQAFIASEKKTLEVDGVIWSYIVEDGDAVEVKPEDKSKMCANGTITSVIIPDSLDGHKVKYLDKNAFDGCTNLTSVVIPDGVIRIEKYAFMGCTSLISINIPNSVTSIGLYAFSYCGSLKSLKIPDSVTTIEGEAFSSCGLESMVIPASVTSIGYSAFGNCESLVTINIPNGITEISGGIFENCLSLKDVKIPEGVISIGWGAFKNCRCITSINIPKGVTSIGDNAFSDCRSLKEILIEEGNTKYKIVDGGLLNEDKTRFLCYPPARVGVKYNVPDGVTSIAKEAFVSSSNLESINLPSTVISIEEHAFWLCNGLKNINIPDNVTSIGPGAFSYCTSLTSINIPNGVKKIEDNTFVKCSELKSINLPEGIGSIGQYVFWNCNSLSSISIPNSVTSIGYAAFSYCTNLTSIIIPRWVRGIETYTFCGCEKLISISIPDSVTSISKDAFWGCQELSTIYADDASFVSGYNWERGTVDTRTGYTVGAMIIKEIIDAKNNAEVKLIEAESALIKYKTKGGLETDNVYKDVKTTISTYSTADLIREETDITKLISWTTKLNEKISNLNGFQITSFTVDSASPQTVGKAITLSSTVIGETGAILKKFTVFDGTVTDASRWTVIKDFGVEGSAIWTPTKAGTYILYANVKDATGKVVTKTLNYVITTPLAMSNVTANVALSATGTEEIKGSLEGENYDTNSDSIVNIIDLANVAKNYNTSKSGMNWQEKYDYNCDGIIDMYDLVKISRKIN